MSAHSAAKINMLGTTERSLLDMMSNFEYSSGAKSFTSPWGATHSMQNHLMLSIK